MSDLAATPGSNYRDHQTHSEVAAPLESAAPGQSSAAPTDPLWLLLPASAFFLLLPALLTFSEIKASWKHWQHSRRINTIIPCRNCYFFNANIRLNCAVHPCRVLTETAADCPDFKLKEAKKHNQPDFLKRK